MVALREQGKHTFPRSPEHGREAAASLPWPCLLRGSPPPPGGGGVCSITFSFFFFSCPVVSSFEFCSLVSSCPALRIVFLVVCPCFSPLLLFSSLFSHPLFSSLLSASLPFSSLAFSSLLFSSLLFSFSSLLFSSLLPSSLLLSSSFFYSSLLFSSTPLLSSLLFFSLPFSSLPFTSLPFPSLPFSSLLFSSPLFSFQSPLFCLASSVPFSLSLALSVSVCPLVSSLNVERCNSMYVLFLLAALPRSSSVSLVT